MFRRARPIVAWLTVAIFIADGVLALVGHRHAHSGACSHVGETTCCVTPPIAHHCGHSHAACLSHDSHHGDVGPQSTHEGAPAPSRDNDNCAACRFLALGAVMSGGVTLDLAGRAPAAVEPPPPRRPIIGIALPFRSRAPPLAAATLS